MNKIVATIKEITSDGIIKLVILEKNEDLFSVLVLEDTANLELRAKVQLVFKETELFLAKDFSGKLSIRNIFNCTIKNIEYGKILSKITLDYKGESLVSLITTLSARNLELELNMPITALIKSNEILIMKMS